MSDTATDSAADGGEALWRVGCAGLPHGVARPRYFSRLDLLELDLTFQEPPRELALRRWKQDAPVGAGFTMLAWQLITHEPDAAALSRLTTPLTPAQRQQAGGFRVNELTREAWQRTLAAARTLAAEAILFQTPPAFSPSTASQEAMRRFFAEVVGEAPGDVTLVWEPRGIWAPQVAGKLAAELGLVYAVDPLQLEIEPPEGPAAYFRLYGMGVQRGRIDENDMDLVADMLEGYEQAWIVFNNVEKYADAQRFRKLLAGRAFVAPDDDGDGGDDSEE